MFDATNADARVPLESASEETFGEMWTLRSGDTVHFTMPKGSVFGSFVMTTSCITAARSPSICASATWRCPACTGLRVRRGWPSDAVSPTARYAPTSVGPLLDPGAPLHECVERLGHDDVGATAFREACSRRRTRAIILCPLPTPCREGDNDGGPQPYQPGGNQLSSPKERIVAAAVSESGYSQCRKKLTKSRFAMALNRIAKPSSSLP